MRGCSRQAQQRIGELPFDARQFLQFCKVHVLEIADFHGNPYRSSRIAAASSYVQVRRRKASECPAGHLNPKRARRRMSWVLDLQACVHPTNARRAEWRIEPLG